MTFGAAETNKGQESGWSEIGQPEQLYERLQRNLEQVEGSLLWQWGHDDRESVGLTFFHHGGLIMAATGVWTVIDAGSVTLQDNATNYVQRIAIDGVVEVNQAGFSIGPDKIPMFQVTTLDGEIDDVLDRRPFVGTLVGEGAAPPSGGGGGGGAPITFADILGTLLVSQLPAGIPRGNLPSTIAYEDEVNTFTLRQNIADLQAPEFECLMRFVAA